MSGRLGKHAYARLHERLRMNKREVVSLLEQGKYILLGKDASTFRIHKLFFSSLDNDWFVVVQDERDGFVVTILPYNYHNRWVISGDALCQARDLAEDRVFQKPTTAQNLNLAVCFRFSVVLEDSRRIVRTVNLDPLPQTEGETITTVVVNSEVLRWVRKQIGEKKALDEMAIEVFVKLGKRGSRIPIELRDLYR